MEDRVIAVGGTITLIAKYLGVDLEGEVEAPGLKPLDIDYLRMARHLTIENDRRLGIVSYYFHVSDEHFILVHVNYLWNEDEHTSTFNFKISRTNASRGNRIIVGPPMEPTQLNNEAPVQPPPLYGHTEAVCDLICAEGRHQDHTGRDNPTGSRIVRVLSKRVSA